MRAFATRSDAASHDLAGRILCHDIRARSGEIVLRKGHTILHNDLPLLARSGQDEIHLLELGPGDLGQRAAGERLAEAIQSPGLLPMAIGHRHVLRATEHGLLDIDAGSLQRLNAIPGVVVFTLRSGEVIEPGQVAAHTQITRLAIEGSAIEEAERIAREQPLVRLRLFAARDAVLWKSGDAIVPSVVPPVREKLRRYGSRLRDVVQLPRDAESIRASLDRALDSGATLFLICGSNALDPLDPVFAALERFGAEICCSSVPVHPGTLLWVAVRGGVTIAGFPPCGLRGEVSAFDLVLPRLLANGGKLEADVAALGHGGLLSHTRSRMPQEEMADDAVR
jgi:molybdopterin biosynthesis enzyme